MHRLVATPFFSGRLVQGLPLLVSSGAAIPPAGMVISLGAYAAKTDNHQDFGARPKDIGSALTLRITWDLNTVMMQPLHWKEYHQWPAQSGTAQ